MTGGFAMAFWRGYAETRVGTGTTRRFLLDLDLTGQGNLNPPTVWNYLDLDGLSPVASPQLRIATVVRELTDDQKSLEIDIEVVGTAVVVDTDVRVVLDTGAGFDQITTPAPATPLTFAYVGYRGAGTGQQMPAKLQFGLTSRKRTPGDASDATDPVTADSDDIDIAAIVTASAEPLPVEGGQLTGVATMQPATETRFVNNVYTEPSAPQARTLSVTGAPDATIASLSLSDPANPTVSVDCLQVKVRTPRRGESPATTAVPVAALAGAGAGSVDVGAHRYKATFVYANGNESKPTASSNAITVADAGADGRVRVTGLPVPDATLPAPTDASLVVQKRRVYRTVASATGDDGEYFLVGEVNDATTTSFTDNVADNALGAVVPDRMFVRYTHQARLDVTGSLTLRTAGVDERYDAVIRRTPQQVEVTYDTRPAAGTPRVTWKATQATPSVEVRVPTFASGTYHWLEARAEAVPRMLGGHWESRGSTRTTIEVCDVQLGRPLRDELGRAEAVLASAQRAWRDALQTVVLELVAIDGTQTAPGKSRTRIGVRGLRHVRVALGEAGVHALDDDGIKMSLSLADDRPPRDVDSRLRNPDRSLRFLKLDDHGQGTDRVHNHVALRVGALPDDLALDLRFTGRSSPGARDEYYGALVQGPLRRVKALVMTDPTDGAAAYAADDQRIWVTVPDVPKSLDVLRTGLDTVYDAAADLFAEFSLRNPRGIDQPAPGELAWQHVKAAAAVPPRVRTAPARVAYGTADAGSTSTQLRDGNTVFQSAWNGGALRYVTGPLAGQRRTITDVAPDGTWLRTDAFTGAPNAGDRYAVEQQTGITIETGEGLGTAGVTGRVAASKTVDMVVAARATPQVRATTAPAPAGPAAPTLQAITGRVYGVREANVTSAGTAAPLDLHLGFDPDRVNTAVRGDIREFDTRFAPALRTMLNARLEGVPDDVTVISDVASSVFELRASSTSGMGAFWIEPALFEDDGTTVAGIGLIEGDVVALPRRARLTIIPSSAPLTAPSVPMNWTPPTGWRPGGYHVETSDTLELTNVRTVTWGHKHPTNASRIWWSRLDAKTIKLVREHPAAATDEPDLDEVWLWTPSEPASIASDPVSPGSGLGYLIGNDVLVSLDIDSCSQETSTSPTNWNSVGPSWQLGQEFQMKDYRGQVTVASPLGASPVGDTSAGPGQWFLRVVDGRPWYIGWGSAYFGNTGGYLASRPRIYA